MRATGPSHLVPPALFEHRLRGRDRQLRRIRAGIARVQRGTGSVVAVTGEAGIGKSRLLGETVELARDAGLSVASASCAELERGRLFGPLIDALRTESGRLEQRRASIAELLARPEIPGSKLRSPDVRFLAHESIVALVEELATDSPLVLTVDDLQWADDATIGALARLGRLAGQLPLVLVGAARPCVTGDPCDRLLRG